ncbi:importin 13 [Geosmithia morbida]|uniref:Importin 13 n=1 Tax=Geosmithia morbida TaxID=1094350 RepID=A0A9P5D1A7_9HYPO|nr:importin 13 [Geosmithia morbida]KAF4120256.1 importin 13 [Geosmithia morbida]
MDANAQLETLDIDQIERLVVNLYEPNQPAVIAATQATLTQLQNSPRAWSIARDLLARADDKVKFHGALIIIIKLNTESSSSLSDNDATELLLNLVGWYLESFSKNSTPLVTRKLASALATFLIHRHQVWHRYIIHLAMCISSGQAHHPGILKDSEAPASALNNLDGTSLQAILWVVQNVMEDASKLDLNSEQNNGLYNTLRESVSDAVTLMSRSMMPPVATLRTYEDATRCLQSWIWFSQRVSSRDKLFIDALRPLLSIVIDATPSAPADFTMELLTDILQNFSSLFTEEHYGMLATLLTDQWAQERHQNILQGDPEFDAFLFGQLLLAFGESKVEALMRGADNQSSGILLSICELLTAEGYPAVENRIFVPTLEFWSTYVETLTDEMYSADLGPEQWVNSAISFAMQAVSNAWQKISFPPPDEFSQWDTNDRTGFIDARKEVADLLQSIYALAGPRIVFTFAELLVTSLTQESWPQVEAAAFCLGSLSDCVRDDARCDDVLFSVFSSPLFASLRDNRSEIPPRVRQTCVSLVEQFTDYFERNTELLPSALNLLFSLLNESGLASPVSKSIHRLCSSCRRHLSPEVWVFMDEYQKLVESQKLDCLSTEKILGGISCVAQGSVDEYQRLAAFRRILAFVEEDLAVSTKSLKSKKPAGIPCSPGSRCLDDVGVESPALHMAVRSLRCLVAMGRGFQSPSEGPIEIDGASRRTLPGPELAEIQRQVFSVILQVESTFSASVEVVELICSILRTGFSESEAGPFVFPPRDIARYLTEHETQTPRIGVLVSTACSFVSSLEKHEEFSGKKEVLSDILLWVISLLRNAQDPESDTELSHNAIDFSSRLISKSPQTLLHLQPFDAAEYLFLFTLKVLNGKEPLPKAAAADFWVSNSLLLLSFQYSKKMALKVTLKTGSNMVSQVSFMNIPQNETANFMAMLGPLLTQSLARNIGGNASRSELDRLSEPIKKLVSRYPSANAWLGSALNDPSFPSTKVTAEQKSLFIKKLISLRGSRATNQLIRDFWLAARGSNFAYVS